MKTQKRSHQQKHGLKCSCCGKPASSFYFHHTAPALPGSAEFEDYKPKRNKSNVSRRVCGPDDLLSMRCDVGKDLSLSSQEIEDLKVGDLVKLSFAIKDKQALWAPKNLRERVRLGEAECMFVRITAISGKLPDLRFQGELVNVPIFLEPSILQFGSKVRFTPDHVYSVLS